MGVTTMSDPYYHEWADRHGARDVRMDDTRRHAAAWSLVAAALLTAACTGRQDAGRSAIFSDDAEFSVESVVDLKPYAVEDYAAIEEAIEWSVPLPDSLPDGALITEVRGTQERPGKVRTGGSQIQMVVSGVGLVAVFPRPVTSNDPGTPLKIGDVEATEVIGSPSGRYFLTWEDCGLTYFVDAQPAARATAVQVAEAFVAACRD